MMSAVTVAVLILPAAQIQQHVTTMPMLVGLMGLVSVASQAILVSTLLFQEAELFFQLMVFGN